MGCVRVWDGGGGGGTNNIGDSAKNTTPTLNILIQYLLDILILNLVAIGCVLLVNLGDSDIQQFPDGILIVFFHV